MIFIFIIILTYFLYGLLSKKIKNKFMCLVTGYFISAISVSLFTFSICLDGWISNSIGSQGACSHHGGVTAKLNGIGLVLFGLCLSVFIINLVMKYKKANTVLEKKESGATTGEREIQAISISGDEYFYRTSSRGLEEAIRNYCSDKGVSFSFTHEIVGPTIISRFKFCTKDFLDEVADFADTYY